MMTATQVVSYCRKRGLRLVAAGPNELRAAIRNDPQFDELRHSIRRNKPEIIEILEHASLYPSLPNRRVVRVVDPVLQKPILVAQSYDDILNNEQYLQSEIPYLPRSAWESWKYLPTTDKIEAYARKKAGAVANALRVKLECDQPCSFLFEPGAVYGQVDALEVTEQRKRASPAPH